MKVADKIDKIFFETISAAWKKYKENIKNGRIQIYYFYIKVL